MYLYTRGGPTKRGGLQGQLRTWADLVSTRGSLQWPSLTVSKLVAGGESGMRKGRAPAH